MVFCGASTISATSAIDFMVNEVDDLSVVKRQFRQAFLQERAMVLLVERTLGIARRIGDGRRFVTV
jgi:hypothetical protein